jgi:LacI family transcriptional regulator
LLEAARRIHLPVVLIAPDVMAPDHVALRCDNLNAGRLVAKHLANLGHRRIAFAGGPEESVDTRQRLEGLQEGLLKHDVRIGAEDIWFGATTERETGVEYAHKFLARSPYDRPSAVVLANDPMALGFMRTVLKHGVRVPEEVSVVGFDGTPDGEQCWPGLTTALQPTQRMAMIACRLLVDRVERRPPEKRAFLTEFTGKILVRESTAAAPGAELASNGRD